MKPTITEQIRCVEREIRMRQRVYPGLVDRRKMAPAECDRELLHMGAVLETLKAAEQLADCLEKAQRLPAPGVDQPEGSVFIQVSDTLAKQIAAQLRGGS